MNAVGCLDFDLLITRSGDGGYRARVVASPVGVAASSFALPFSDLEIENFLLRMGQMRTGMRGRDTSQETAAREFGKRLFGAVFDGEVATCWYNSVDAAGRSKARLRLRLTDAPELFDLPWEYLYDATANRFVTLSTKTPLVRYLELAGEIATLPVQPPLRILVLISSPQDLEALDVEREWDNLQTALADLVARNAVQLVRCPAPTLSELQRTLRREECHIFHFVGHGAYDMQEQDGVLLFADDQGRSRAVSGRHLGALLHDEGQLRLAVLNACEGGRASRLDPFAGAGQSLLQQGVPAVIAMQFAITDSSAATFAHEFYAAIADGFPIDGALAEARKAIFAQSKGVDWGTPVLYMRSVEGNIFDLIPLGAAVAATRATGGMSASPPAASPAAPAQPAPVTSAAATAAPRGAPFVAGSTQDAPVQDRPQGKSQGKSRGTAGLLFGALVLVTAAIGLFFWLRNSSALPGSTGAPAVTGDVTVVAAALSDNPSSGRTAATAEAPTPEPTAAAAPAAAVQAAVTPDAVLAFEYNFDEGSAPGWTGAAPAWTVVPDETGNYVYQASAPADSWTAAELPSKVLMSQWRNYTVSLRIRALQASSNPELPEVWISTRSSLEPPPGCNYYYTVLDFTAKLVKLNKDGKGPGCSDIPIAAKGFPNLNFDTWYNVSITMNDDRLQVTVDGTPLIDATDGSVDQGYAYLTVGNSAIVQIDDVKVYKPADGS